MPSILPIIKWTGSKRHVATAIVSRFPKKIDTYWEPCIGSGAITIALLLSDVRVNDYQCSDINSDLISLWNLIKTDRMFLSEYYRSRWTNLNKLKDIGDKKKFYYDIRQQFNIERRPEQFFFLTRTSYNGLVRYNNNGYFNSPFHFNRDGIHPDKLDKLLDFWSGYVQRVHFSCRAYEQIKPEVGDFVMIDPPYFNVTSSIYNGKIDENVFIEFLRGLKCGWIATLDGRNDVDDRTYRLPVDIFTKHEYLKMGNSSLRRLLCRNNVVHESLYIKEV